MEASASFLFGYVMSVDIDLINGRLVERRLKPKVQFYDHAALDMNASREEGRRVYSDTLYIKIQSAIDKDFISKKATEEHKRQFSDEYNQYLREKDAPKNIGKPLSLMFENKSDIAGLHALGITTIEQLATIDVLPDEFKPHQRKAKGFILFMSDNDDSKDTRRSEDPRRQVN